MRQGRSPRGRRNQRSAVIGTLTVLLALAIYTALTVADPGAETGRQGQTPPAGPDGGSNGSGAEAGGTAEPPSRGQQRPDAPGASGRQPASASASQTATPGTDGAGAVHTYPPANATDQRPETTWQVDGDGTGDYIQLNYTEEVTVDRIGVIPGYDKVDPVSGVERFGQRHRVKEAEIEFSDGSTRLATFDDDARMQSVEVEPTATDYVRITIRDTYPPDYTWDDSPDSTAEPVDDTAISEIKVEGG